MRWWSSGWLRSGRMPMTMAWLTSSLAIVASASSPTTRIDPLTGRERRRWTLPSGADALTVPGLEMVGLIGAVGALGEAGIGRYAIVDGVDVTVGLGKAHRVTADVDTVVDETTPPDAVEAFLARSDTRRDPTEPHRVFVDGTKVEILPVRPLDDNDLNGISTNDALFVAAHAWPLDTTAVTVIAGHDGVVRVTAPFATPAALVAMKLDAIETATGLVKTSAPATHGTSTASSWTSTPTRPYATRSRPGRAGRCEVEVPALLFRVGESVADRCGHVRAQVVQHDVDRVPVGSEFDRDLVQSATAHAADSGPGTRDRSLFSPQPSQTGREMAGNHVQRFRSPTSFDTSNVLVKPAFFAPPGGFEPPSLV